MKTEKPFYQLTIEQTAHQLGVDIGAGLSAPEVKSRLAQYGPNQLPQKKRISPWAIFFGQFKDLLIGILLIAAVVSLAVGRIEEGGSSVEGILILVIVLAIALVGFLNEYKAEKTVEALKKLIAQKARVRRGGEVIEIDSKDLVPGDVVILEEGQKIPADIRLTSVVSLQANEASLTGESLPTSKKEMVIGDSAALGDLRNMVFSGTTISVGKGEGLVVATGAQTEIGKIAKLVDEEEEGETPMQKKLDALGRQLGFGILAICAVVFVSIFFLDSDLTSLDLLQRSLLAFTAAVALAVAAIPEGLAFVVRISLALGARRMADKNALVRKLSAVEALGSTDIICTDKTGTLTKGEMTVRELWIDRTLYEVTGGGYSTEGDFHKNGQKTSDTKPIELLLKIGLWCNNAQVKDEKVIGDPTEGALIVSAQKAGLTQSELPRVGEIPFSSDRKLMSTIHSHGGGYLVAVKGATELLLEKCQSIEINGQPTELTSEMKKTILDENHRMSAGSLRVLGFAYKSAKTKPDESNTETDLTFVGLQGMMDPPRIEIKEVIQTVTTQSGMQVVMITGDYIETAKAIAREIGLRGVAISGPELDKLSQEEFEAKVCDIAVFARVNPEHKIRIVKALQKNGNQVAMTGDGVNDAPAIKAADIGIAMGITGTDVAKEAADLILLDDQFLTIINAIEEGRGIFDNVRKFVNYLMSANIAEVLVVLFGVLFFNKLVLTAVQLLFINIVTDGLPAVALGSDPAEKGIMRYKPDKFQGSIISKRLWVSMVVFGALMTAFVLAQFTLNLHAHGLGYAVSVAFTAMVILEMVRLIDIRSYYKVKWSANPWLVVAIVSSVILQLIVLYVPFFANIFHVDPVELADWLVIAAGGAGLFVAMRIINKLLVVLIPDNQPRPRAAPAV